MTTMTTATRGDINVSPARTGEERGFQAGHVRLDGLPAQVGRELVDGVRLRQPVEAPAAEALEGGGDGRAELLAFRGLHEGEELRVLGSGGWKCQSSM